jgi:hypothetical protein
MYPFATLCTISFQDQKVGTVLVFLQRKGRAKLVQTSWQLQWQVAVVLHHVSQSAQVARNSQHSFVNTPSPQSAMDRRRHHRRQDSFHRRCRRLFCHDIISKPAVLGRLHAANVPTTDGGDTPSTAVQRYNSIGRVLPCLVHTTALRYVLRVVHATRLLLASSG